MMKKLGTKKSAAKTHFYPLAMATYDIMPPPSQSEKDIGEKRIVNYTGVGLSLGEEIDVSNSGEWTENLGEEADLPIALSEYIWGKVKQEYDKISKYCDPKADEIAVDTGGIRPIKPPSVPKFD
jgi:glycerol-3-phosphate O-acyltransferase